MFQAFFEPDDDRSARIILLEGPLSRDKKESNFTLDLSVLRSRCGRLGFRCFSSGGRSDLESKLAIVKWVAGPNDRISLLTARRHRTRRIKTETERFNVAYDHEMYASRKTGNQPEDPSGFTLLGKISSQATRKSEDPITVESLLNLPSAKVVEGDNVFKYHKGYC